jgi:hypothetical protein
MKITQDRTVVFFRLMITGEVAPDGKTLNKNADLFNLSCGA